MKWRPSNWDGADVTLFAILLALAGLVGVGLWAVVSTLRAQDGDVKYCYTEYYNQNNVLPPAYVVRGYVPWRSNVVIGVTQTQEQAESLLRGSATCQRGH